MDGTKYSVFWSDRSKIKVIKKDFENEQIEIMALTVDLAKHVQSLPASAEMIDYAANAGLMFNRKRIIDDEELSQDFDLWWDFISKEYDSECSIKEQVGTYVCKISDIGATLEATIAKEVAAEEEAELKALEDEEDVIVNGDSGEQSDIAAGLEHHQKLMEAS